MLNGTCGIEINYRDGEYDVHNYADFKKSVINAISFVNATYAYNGGSICILTTTSYAENGNDVHYKNGTTYQEIIMQDAVVAAIIE